MWIRRSVRWLTLAGVVGMVAWACGSGGGMRDMHYNTDVGAGYTGPDLSFSEATGGGDAGTASDAVTGAGG